MKKLLALMLVLGITTVANAAIMLSVNGDTSVETYEMEACGTILIDVTSDDANPYGCYLELFDAQGEWTTGGEFTGVHTIYHEAGGDASVEYVTSPVEILAIASGTPLSWIPSPGKHFDFVYHCLGAYCEWVYVQLWDYDYTVVLDEIAIHQIPEPASMLLLGLGGLLLKRRK